MNAKEIGRKAGEIFRYIKPANWIYRSQEDQEDYGIDAEIELTDSEDHATGFIFKVQIKGKVNVSLIDSNKYVSLPLKVARLKYYINQLEIPVILIVVDITTEKIYWKSLQNDISLRNKLNQRIDGDFNVHLSVINNLTKENSIDLLNAVKVNYDWLRLNALGRIKDPIMKIIDDLDSESISKILKNTKKTNLFLFNKQFDDLFQKKQFDDLLKLANKVLKSETENIVSRFTAGLAIEKVYLIHFGLESEDFEKRAFDLYVYMIRMIRKEKCPDFIKYYAILLLRKIRLKLFIETDYHHFITKKMSEKDNMLSLVVSFTKTNYFMKAVKEVNHVIRLVNKIIYSENIYVLLDILPRVIPRLSFFANRLVMDGLTEQSEFLYKWLQFCVDSGLKLSDNFDDETYKAQIIILNCTYKINTPEAADKIEQSKELSNKIKDESLRFQLLEDLKKYEDAIKSKNQPMDTESELEYFRERAKALGMDPDDPKNEYGKIIRHGLEDYNPERVLKTCESIFVFPSRALGLPAQMVGLVTATSKYIYCLKHKHWVGGWSLDESYKLFFEKEYCVECNDNIPRENDWKWTSQWQRDMMEKHKEIIEEVDN